VSWRMHCWQSRLLHDVRRATPRSILLLPDQSVRHVGPQYDRLHRRCVGGVATRYLHGAPSALPQKSALDAAGALGRSPPAAAPANTKEPCGKSSMPSSIRVGGPCRSGSVP
jgi:hypothetical protein